MLQAIVVLQDLTEVRRVETVRREFVANVSHELRTPLASLKALVETLQDGALDDPSAAQRFLSQMDTEVDGLTQMVTELLELSRIESGQVTLKPEPADLRLLISTATERLHAQAQRAGIVLAAEVPEGLPKALVDSERIQHVLINLIHNAIKFTPPGGRVTVSAAVDEKEMRIAVADTGVGIAAEDITRIFERFYKVDKSRSSGGTGLGLAIAKHIVQAHGGRICAESVEGKGATFTFTVPVA
jgi:two-component system phosphate regulon sensor histidine kinase PhoR